MSRRSELYIYNTENIFAHFLILICKEGKIIQRDGQPNVLIFFTVSIQSSYGSTRKEIICVLFARILKRKSPKS